MNAELKSPESRDMDAGLVLTRRTFMMGSEHDRTGAPSR